MPGTIGAARVLESTFASDYHGLQLSAERRGTRFSAKAYYTFGRALEDLDYQGGGLPAVQNSNRIELERGRTSADRTHSFVFSGIWKLDYVKDSTDPLLKALLERLDAVRPSSRCRAARRSRSAPVRIATSTALTTDRADLIGDPKLDSGRPREELIEQWFNTAAFAQPALGTDGTAGRSIVEGPGYRNVDLGLFRDIGWAAARVQFRMEATNVFNTVNLQNPDTNLNARATFGRIRSARDMRRIQLGARFSF